MVFGGIVLLSIAGLFIYLLGLKSKTGEEESSKIWAWQAIGLGLLGIFLAGWPYWMIDLPMSLGFPNSRVTLSFMTGISFLLAGLLGLLPGPRWDKTAHFEYAGRAGPLGSSSVLPTLSAGIGRFRTHCSGR